MPTIACNPSRYDHQSEFFSPLINPEFAPPCGLQTWNGSDPAQRYAIYRNNVTVSLAEALADNFPTICTQVGEEFFAAMATCYIREYLPDSPILAFYGAQMPEFIAGFAPLKDFPWLSDLARMDIAFIQSWHAKDAQAPSHFDLPDDAAHLRAELHPSLRLLSSPWAIYSLWMRDHNGEQTDEYLDPNQAEYVMLFRPLLEVTILSLSMTNYRFIEALMTGKTLGQAMEECHGIDVNFDPVPALQILIQQGLVLSFSTDTIRETR